MGESTRDTTTSVMASAELDGRWLSGDPDAFEEIYARYRSRLEAVACRILGSHADAEDVVQNVFQALPHAAYRGSASLWSYLYRAAVNGSINLLRSRRRAERLQAELTARALVPGSMAGCAPDSSVFGREVLAAVARALLRLRPEYRRVLLLRIVHDLSHREIAAREGVPVATVATWMRRGREQLRQRLGPVLWEL
jgi:RNA polymerase sigma-70 factor (ECF subfamily)